VIAGEAKFFRDLWTHFRSACWK